MVIVRMTAIVVLLSVYASAAPGAVFSCRVQNRYRPAENGEITPVTKQGADLTKILVDSGSGAVIDEQPLPSGMQWKLVGRFTQAAAASVKLLGYDNRFNVALTLVIFSKGKENPFLYQDLRSGLLMSGDCSSK